MKFKQLFFLITFFCLLITPTFSFADDYIEEDIPSYNLEIEASSNLSNIPNINARYSVILDRASKTVLFGKQENEKCKMASTTKIMTAIVVIENCNNLNDVVTISKQAARNRRFKTRIINKR